MRLRPIVGSTLTLAFIAGVIAACGARTGLDIPPPAPVPPECVIDDDCANSGHACNPVVCRLFQSETDAGIAVREQPGGTCVKLTPINCDDNDACTTDSCDSDNGKCSYTAATFDLDHDGHKGPLPGHVAGAPGSCGDDCDDTNANAYPGNTEVCDGVDNDCNGIVDDNASYTPLQIDATRIDGDIAPAEPGGIAWSGTSYAAIYSGGATHFDMYRNMLQQDGTSIPPGETRITEVNADSGGGPVVWIGDRYGLLWQDRRDGDYEIYSTILKPDGSKAVADTRLTFAPGFSINPSLAWNGVEFIAVWQDERNGAFDVFGQRIGVDGSPVGDNVSMTQQTGQGNESPVVAIGVTGIGVVWSFGDAFSHQVVFQIFDQNLQPSTATPSPIDLTDGSTEAVYPTLVYNKGKNGKGGTYVAAWYDRTASPKAIYGVEIGEDGQVQPTKQLTSPGAFRSRYPFLKPLGDRLLLVYSDDRDQNNGYELYTRMIDASLNPLSPESRLTNAPMDSILPVAAFGPSGDVGVLFRDDRVSGEHHIFFTHLGCVTKVN